MTGLKLGQDKIIEIAVIITDHNLNPVDNEGFERVVHCSEAQMKNMGEWCTEQHMKVITVFTTLALMGVVWFNCTCVGFEKLNSSRRGGLASLYWTLCSPGRRLFGGPLRLRG
jgi:hypothetical protein